VTVNATEPLLQQSRGTSSVLISIRTTLFKRALNVSPHAALYRSTQLEPRSLDDPPMVNQHYFQYLPRTILFIPCSTFHDC
jgi:hypothetical protein